MLNSIKSNYAKSKKIKLVAQELWPPKQQEQQQENDGINYRAGLRRN